MSEIVIRHAEPSDAEAFTSDLCRNLRCITTRYSSLILLRKCGKNALKPQPGRRQLVACIDNQLAGNLTLMVEQNPRRSHVATFGMAVSSAFHNRGVASALMREMINLCDNWLRIDRIELTVFVDNAPALAVYRKFRF